uniref:Uncharacterized protein n=1 Tax=Arundo donax TaxID=35708 RepID=A0A0A8Z6B4_ARUDO
MSSSNVGLIRFLGLVQIKNLPNHTLYRSGLVLIAHNKPKI